MPSTPVASILVPTRGRPEYLEVALRSIGPQAEALRAEVLVINDGGGIDIDSIARRLGARPVSAPSPGGLNVARNAGIAAAASDLIVLVDDDVEAPPGWLQALLRGIGAAPSTDVFGGPIRARLEGGGPRSCGREGPLITALDLGDADRDVELVWGANMALRRRALELAGPFDESLSDRGDRSPVSPQRWDSRGDEEEWERRYIARGGTIRYVGGAWLDHRRTRADARLSSLVRAGYAQGARARRFDVHKHVQPPIRGELRTLAGCAWHIVRRRCVSGFVLVAHSTGRVLEALRDSR